MAKKSPRDSRRDHDAQSIGVWAPKSRLIKGPAPVIRPDFKPACLDFDHGIRVGNLEPNQRITRILKQALETRHQTDFVTDRWGRGVYWQWICWVARENRAAKPHSSNYNFSCAKFYITVDTDDKTFEAGMQIERARTKRVGDGPVVADDWDFFNLVRGLRRGTPLADEIARLVRGEGFTVRAGSFSGMTVRTGDSYKGPADLARACRHIPDDEWGGFQLCYTLPQADIKAMTGDEIVRTILAIFDEVAPAMNAVMTVPCLKAPPPGGRPSSQA